MHPIVRFAVLAMLCAVASIGRVPAWLHVAGIDKTNTKQIFAARPSGTHTCRHCCGSPSRLAERDAKSIPTDSHGGGDHDTCVTCQVLSAPNGVGSQVEFKAASELWFQNEELAKSMPPISKTVSEAHPRGPPAAPF